MIKSMTGFGQHSVDDGSVQISAEVKSLNSKFLDLNLRLPKIFSDKEIEVRNLISEQLERGKVSVVLEYQEYGDAEIKQSYNQNLFVGYYTELKRLADRVVAPYDNLFELALNSPDVIQGKSRESSDEDAWKKLRACLVEALKKCEQFRCDEGKSLGTMLKQCTAIIGGELKNVGDLDPRRVARI